MLRTLIFRLFSDRPPIPTPTPSIKLSSTKIPRAPPIPGFLSNSTTDPAVIATQLPPVQVRAASEPKSNMKPLPSPPALNLRQTPTPPQPRPLTNGHKKPSTPPGTINKGKIPSPEKIKPTIQKPIPSPIFVPPPIVPTISNVRLGANLEVGRLQMEDLAEKEFNQIYESYIDHLLEEVIQSDFEKPSIPEVILAVITDLTNDDRHHDDDDDDDGGDRDYPNDEGNHIDLPVANTLERVYHFNQDKFRSASPHVNNNTQSTINNDIDYYYTHVHQTVANTNDISNHDSIRSTNSSNQSIGLLSTADAVPSYVQVRNRAPFVEPSDEYSSPRLEQRVVGRFERRADSLDPTGKRKRSSRPRSSNHTTTINCVYLSGKHKMLRPSRPRREEKGEKRHRLNHRCIMN